MDKNQKERLDDYRTAILKALLDKTKDKESQALDEQNAQALLAQLTDEELTDGILFNTPEDVADILLEP